MSPEDNPSGNHSKINRLTAVPRIALWSHRVKPCLGVNKASLPAEGTIIITVIITALYS